MHSVEERIRANAADPLNCGQDRRIFVQRNLGGNAQRTRQMFNGLPLLRHALGRRVGRQGDPGVAWHAKIWAVRPHGASHMLPNLKICMPSMPVH